MVADRVRGLAETQREIGCRRIAAGEARTAIIRRWYDAAIEDVWDACTSPERIGRWFLTVTGELRLGGTFHLRGNASGEVLRCEPPRLLRVSWAYGDRPTDEVELRLSTGADGGTLLELEHASVSRLVEVDGRWVDPFLNDEQMGLWGAGIGWELPLVYRLTRELRGELAGPPADEPSPEERALADRLGRAWVAVVATAGAMSGNVTAE
jgi:uncharacterized protein YndB with AHSA1/START domain